MPGFGSALGLKLIIEAVDNATATIEKVDKSTKKLELSWGGLAKTIAIAGVAMAGAMLGLGVAVLKLGERSNLLEDVGSSFRGLAGSVGESMDTLMAKMHATTGGMISDFDLMTSANALLRLNVAKTGEDVAEIIEVAAKLAESQGKEYANSAETLARAISTGMARSLLELGIDINAVKSAVAGLGLTMEEAARSGQLLPVVLDAARATLARTGKDTQTLGDAIDRMGASWTNMKDDIARSAGPFANDIAATLSAVMDRFRPAIQTMFTGFFEMLRAMWSVAKETVKTIASAMGIDMDTLGADAKTWGENVIIQFATGMANAFVWVVNVLNQLGNLIASWLAPGSPPRILPEIDKWGRDTIQAYLDGMGEGINYDEASKALKGIERFFELEMRPLSERLAAIGHERADIGDAKELARLQRRMGYGYANPQQERLAQLRIEEIQAEMKLRDLEAERGAATTRASDILFPLERQVELTKALVKATEGLAGVEPPEWMSGDSEFWQKLPGVELSEEFQAKMATIFKPLQDALAGLVGTWGAVFGVTGGTGYDVGAGPVGRAAARRSLGDIVKAGLLGVSNEIAIWWGTTAPIWEATLLQWLVKLPEKVWATFMFNRAVELGVRRALEATAQQELLADQIAIWDREREERTEHHKQTMITIATFMAGAYNTLVGGFVDIANEIIRAANVIRTVWAIATRQVIPPDWDPISWTERKPEDYRHWYPTDEMKEGESSGAPVKAAFGADFWTRGPQLLLVGEGTGREHVQVTPEGKAPAGNTYNLHIHTSAPTENIIADFAILSAFA